MFIKLWLAWSSLGLVAGIALFFYAVKTGQFRESRRAALLPLEGGEIAPRTHSKRGRGLLWFLVGLGIMAAGLTIAMVCSAMMAA